MLEEFIENVETLFNADKHEEDGFITEFQKIKLQSAFSKENYLSTFGEKSEDKKKHRYKVIVSFDYNRVKLPSTDVNNSNCINASSLKGTNNTSAYSASQEPLPLTVNNFCKMLWSQKIKVVLMIC